MGEFYALLTALLWAIGVILLKRASKTISPFALNFYKNSVALVALLFTLLVLHQWPLNIKRADLILFFISGALGIGLADLLFLITLKKIGASRTALVDCLYVPFIVVLAYFFLEEKLRWFDLVGGVFILTGVFLCSWGDFGEKIPKRQLWIGISMGALAMLVLAFALIMIKQLLTQYPIFWLNTVRMMGGVSFLLVGLFFHPRPKKAFEAFKFQPEWKVILIGSLFATYLSTAVWLASLKYTQTGIATILCQLSTVLIIIFATLFLREKLTKLKILALAISFVGAILVLIR